MNNDNNIPASTPDQKNNETDPTTPHDEEQQKTKNTGMDMGTDFEEEKEQDLDELVHSRTGLHDKDAIPAPDER